MGLLKKDADIRIRIEKEMKEEFIRLMEEVGDTPSAFLRRTIIQYIRKHAQGGASHQVDAIWIDNPKTTNTQEKHK